MSMSAYANFEFYQSTYLGNVLSSTEFPRLALRASVIIDQLTFDQAEVVVTTGTDTDTIEKIKLATCAVAEKVKQLDGMESGGEIASERVGNHSVSYVQNPTAQLSDDAKFRRVAKLYLWGTGLMFAGVNCENAA